MNNRLESEMKQGISHLDVWMEHVWKDHNAVRMDLFILYGGWQITASEPNLATRTMYVLSVAAFSLQLQVE